MGGEETEHEETVMGGKENQNGCIATQGSRRRNSEGSHTQRSGGRKLEGRNGTRGNYDRRTARRSAADLAT